MNEIRDVKRLYLSGNPIPLSFPNERFYNLVYLELAMCQLESLPQDLAALLPNVRAINLNFNFISDLSPLIGLTRLKKVEAVGARLSKFRGLKEAVSSWPEIETVDFRFVSSLVVVLRTDFETQDESLHATVLPAIGNASRRSSASFDLRDSASGRSPLRTDVEPRRRCENSLVIASVVVGEIGSEISKIVAGYLVFQADDLPSCHVACRSYVGRAGWNWVRGEGEEEVDGDDFWLLIRCAVSLLDFWVGAVVCHLNIESASDDVV